MAGVIRRECSPPTPAFSFDDLERRAREILSRAHAEAARVLQSADVQARAAGEALRRQAHETGLAQGRQEGLEEMRREARQAVLADARQEVERLVQALTTVLAEFDRDKRRLIALAESGLIELAVAIARRVCKTSVAASAEPMQDNIRALLEMVKGHVDAEIRVHPAELERLREVAGDFVQKTAELEHVAMVADPTLDRGGCVLRTRDGVIDASIEAQLDRVAAALGSASETAAGGTP